MPSSATPRIPLDRKAATWLAAVTFVLFWFTTGNRFIDLDDDFYLAKNLHVVHGLTGSGIQWAFTNYSYFYWQPLAWISHMADIEFYGLNPFGHHLTNVILHAINALLFYWAMLRFTGKAWGSVFAAAVFALHPLRVESVAWVAERKDLLSACFWLLSLISYESYVRLKTSSSYWRTVGVMVLGLASKPTVVTLPFVFLLLDYWPLQRAESLLSRLREKLPMFLLALVSSVLTFLGQQEMGAVVAVQTFSFSVRLANAVQSYVKYLGKMLWPHPLAVFYPYQPQVHPALIAACLLLLLALTALAIWQWKKRPYLLIGWLYYLGTMVPVIGFVQVGMQAMADRFTYIPMFGILLAVVCLLPEFPQRNLLYLIPACLGVATFLQIGLWKDSQTLFTHTLAVAPANPLLRNNLGHILATQGNHEGAIENFREALRLEPTFYLAQLNLAMELSHQGKHAEAMTWIDRSIEQRPSSGDGYFSRASVLMAWGKQEQAAAAFEEALQRPLRPDEAAHAHTNLGKVIAQKGDPAAAEKHFRAAIGLLPDFVPAHRNLAASLIDQQRIDEAIRSLTMAVHRTRSSELHQLLQSLQGQPGR